ncbi:MAG TPA: efflux RND transporter periplasmic adaptor subunit, partial [Chryseolinea sp.]|nr:efflux RND transporter periplasmic adaptor subunit [Chryseolinea sp.]
AEHADTYTCPMHPTVISEKPGVCPVCGMDLVRKAREGEEVKITEDLAKLIKSPNEIVASSITTVKPTYKAMDGSIEALGIVTYDSRNVYIVPARIGGRLEKVYLKYPFQKVSKGQKIAEIYSPEGITAQRELLYLLENDPGNNDLINGSKNKLLLLGFSSAQIDDLIKRKDPSITFSMYSAYDGYVIKEDQQAPAIASSSSASKMDGGMVASAQSGSENSGLLIRAGSYVSPGQTIFKIVNTSSLFVELNLPVSEAGSVKADGEISLEMGSGIPQKKTIALVQPFFERGVEFIKLRVYMKRSENIQIGQLVKATLPVHFPETLWVPKDAVVDLGLDHIVFVKDREVFNAVKVITGMHTDGWIEVKNGLASSDELADNAQYLVDSESFIKSK